MEFAQSRLVLPGSGQPTAFFEMFRGRRPLGLEQIEAILPAFRRLLQRHGEFGHRLVVSALPQIVFPRFKGHRSATPPQQE